VISDSLRSFGLLALAFGGVVVAVLGLSGLLVPTPDGTVFGPDGRPVPASSATPPPVVAGVPGLGGTLTVSGDREGTFRLTTADEGAQYALTGTDGRVVFEGAPAEVVQVSYDGLEFFPDPGDCTLESGNLEGLIGIGFVELACTALTDIRDNGTIDLAGEIGMPLDLLAERSLPPSGGSLAVGDETWEFVEAELSTWQLPIRGGVHDYHLVLHDPNRGTLSFLYDYEAHRLLPGSVSRHGEERRLEEDACSFEREELGQHNPRTVVIELTITCPEIEVPGLGSVAVGGTIVVDELQWPI
jgi:hypothetical protein